MNPLQYITQDHPKWTHSELVQLACEAGVKWIQLRMKNASGNQIREEATKAKAICTQYKTTLILNDQVEIAKELDLDGVHLGLTDLPTDQAREILGADKIIGGTANTLADVLMHVKRGVNYVGVGPFQFTSTKKNLSPVLGYAGYELITMYLCEQNIKTPIVGIGGITTEHFARLQDRGVNAIAVSGLITNAFETGKAEKIIRQYEQLEEQIDAKNPYSMLWKWLRAGQIEEEIVLERDEVGKASGIRSDEARWSIHVVNQRVVEEHWQDLKSAEDRAMENDQIRLIHAGYNDVSTLGGAKHFLQKHSIIQ